MKSTETETQEGGPQMCVLVGIPDNSDAIFCVMTIGLSNSSC